MNHGTIMDISAFDLLIRAMHRTFISNKKTVTVTDDSLFLNQITSDRKSTNSIHLFNATTAWWVTIEDQKFEYKRPGFFSFRERKTYDKLIPLIKEMFGRGFAPSSIEDLICKNIYAAKEIIAERALVGDHE